MIEVRVAELKQLFNAIDPSPFREKDLDPNAEEFIVSRAREAPRDTDRQRVERTAVGEVLRESLLIGGWVAMWRPLEIFLYDWWPIRSEARLYDRLSAMPVRIAYTGDARSESWRRDWPAASPRAAEPGRTDGQ